MVRTLRSEKNIKKAEEMFYWANLKVDVCDYVKKCITCQRFKGESESGSKLLFCCLNIYLLVSLGE